MARFTLEALPHQEAIEYLRSKGYAHELVRFHHMDHWREDHARNWVVAKAMRDDVSQVIRAEVERMLVEGRTFQQASADLAPRLQEMGWWGKGLMEDPATGEMEEAQLGSMSRLRTIFDTNMRTAHAAGNWAAIQRTKKAFPYLHYIQIDRPTKRHSHERFHDKIWHVDDPIWLRIYPPNGYFCGCRVIQRTEGWMRRNSRTVSERLDLDEIEWEHPRSGETHMIPRGITPGFDVNPGAVWLDMRAGLEKVTPDLTPEQRAAELGVLEGLRLRRLSDPRESTIILDAASEPLGIFHATAEAPGRVGFSFDGPANTRILHSHLGDTPLSPPDIRTMHHLDAYSITAVGPGGLLSRAIRGPVPFDQVHREFHELFAAHKQELELLPKEEASSVLAHAFLRWLEKRQVLTYHFHLTARSRQVFDRHADLIRRLSDVRLDG